MGAVERRRDRGAARGERLVRAIAEELRLARVSAGLSQERVAAAAGVSRSRLSRIERARVPGVSISILARLSSVLGMDLAVRAYPVANPLRDRAHLALLAKLRERIHPSVRWESEAPIGRAGDLRAWDARLVAGGVRIGVDAETRIVDAQALLRRTALKRRDDDIDRVLLLVANTRANRSVLLAVEGLLRAEFPVPEPAALRALSEGRAPDGSTIVVL